MVVTKTNIDNKKSESSSSTYLAGLAIFLALSLCCLRALDLLPAVLMRVPETMIPPFADWLDKVFNFFRYTLKMEVLTRAIAEGPLEFLLDTTANLLYGKRRWPNLGPTSERKSAMAPLNHQISASLTLVAVL